MTTATKWGSVVSAVCLMVGICAVPALAGQHTERPDNGFAPTGPWNTKLPADVPLAPDSAAVVASIAQDEQDTNGAWGLNTDTYSTPIFASAEGRQRSLVRLLGRQDRALHT